MYLDDGIVISNSVEVHLQHVADFLRVVADAIVSLKLSKCEFIRTTFTYLGHVFEPIWLEIEACASSSLKKSLLPRNWRELRSFIGPCVVYRRFIYNFAHITGPLNEFLRKGSLESF